MLEKPLAKLEELEKRLDRLIKSAPRFSAALARVKELERETAELSENLSREKAARGESDKSSTARVAELEGRAVKLEECLAREKKLRDTAAGRVSELIRDLDEEKPDNG